MQIVLQPEVCRGETTWQWTTSKAEQADENIRSLEITEHLPLEEGNAAIWKLQVYQAKNLNETPE